MWFFIIIVSQCTATKRPLRIHGGIDVKPDEYPYVVRIEIQRQFRVNNSSIYYKQKHLCTASALSPEWVLSAAHCIDDFGVFYYGPPYSVEKLVIRHGHVKHLPGIHDSFSDVLFTVVNPKYVPYRSSVETKHDIGRLKTNPMTIKNFVKLSAVDYKCFYGQEAIFAGFGVMTKIFPDGNIDRDVTLNLKMPLQVLKVLITKCNDLFLEICIVSRCDHVSHSCEGDSGGPLLHPSGVIGVLSRGPSTGFCLEQNFETKTTDTAGVITPVNPYLEWIYKIIRS